MRRVLAPFASLAFLAAAAISAVAQVNPPVTPPPGPVNPPGTVITPVPTQPPPANAPSGAPDASPAPAPAPAFTPPPIIVDPPQVGVEPGKTAIARVNSAFGTIAATVADPAIASVVADQAQRALFISGIKLGTTTVTVTDMRGLTREVPVRVAYAAGSFADQVTLRVTGNPVSIEYLREAAARAASEAATLRPGASVNVAPESISVRAPLKLDERTEIDAPVTIAGDGYFGVNGTTRVLVENVALPPILPAQLLVSDYPERLTANGVLFTAQLGRDAQRFLYYHYNPGTEPARRILLKARNSSNAPATVQMIDGIAGPGGNEMEIGHLSTRRFLMREARNEGTVRVIPPNTTLNLIDHPMPPQNVLSGILQLRLVSGDPLDLTLLAQDARAPVDQSVESATLLAGGARHARGVYPVPTFSFEDTYDVEGPDLEIPIGQLPLPNLREGEALSGDYGVEQRIRVVVVNNSRGPKAVALYANPRGGRATGTFLVDRVLVQAHALPAFSKFKIWQETIPARQFRRLEVVTMPEGGSSYPLRLIFAPDDGSVPPGAPGSLIY